MSSNNIPTAGYALFADIFTGESAATISKMQIGSGTTDEALTDATLAAAYTDNGFEEATVTGSYTSPKLTFTHTFTNTGTTTRQVREVGLFSSTGQLMYRYVFSDSELPNFGNVPAGKAITLTVTLTFRDSAISQTLRNESSVYTADTYYTIYVSGVASAAMDITTFDTPAAVCYNGVPIRNASPPKLGENFGAKTWQFTSYTKDYADITAILAFAGPVQTGNSIVGKQYVISAFRSGVLAILNTTTRAMDTFSNCYVQGPINVTPFGDGWWYDVSVIQSAYPEVV